MDDLHRRLRAARQYLGVSQTELGVLLGGMSKDYVMKVESERGLAELEDFERRTLIAGYSKATHVPEPWFSADWHSLTADVTPEQRNHDYAKILSELRKALTDADLTGRKDMKMLVDALKEVGRRLSYIEGKLNVNPPTQER